VKGALEHDALGREAVDVRRLHVRMPARAELVVAQIVDEDYEKIRFFLAHGLSFAGPL